VLGDRWGVKQSVVIPEINDKFIGFEIENQGLSWCHGEVIAIKDTNKKTVTVRWAVDHVGEGEQSETIQKNSDSEWNISREGAWWEYLME
jgi:hypothetical protein